MMRLKSACTICLAAAAAGCATDTVIFRVIEYDAAALLSRAGGCAVHRTPATGERHAERIEFVYAGQRCSVRAVSRD
jgi:hypothetical protein